MLDFILILANMQFTCWFNCQDNPMFPVAPPVIVLGSDSPSWRKDSMVG